MLAKLGDIWNGAEGFYIEVENIEEARTKADLYGFVFLGIKDDD